MADLEIYVNGVAVKQVQTADAIALDLREAHRNDFFSVPGDNPLKGKIWYYNISGESYRKVDC